MIITCCSLTEIHLSLNTLKKPIEGNIELICYDNIVDPISTSNGSFSVVGCFMDWPVLLSIFLKEYDLESLPTSTKMYLKHWK